MPGSDLGLRRVQALDGAHPRPVPSGPDGELVADVHRPAREGAGHHRSGAGRHERPIHPQAWPAGVGGGRGAGQQPVQGGGEVAHTRPGDAVHRHDLGAGQKRAGQAVRHVEVGDLGEFLVDEVDLREHDQAGGDAQEFEDSQVLLGLRLPALGGGHHEDAGVGGTHAGQHVPDEADVAGNVHDGAAPPARQRGGCEPQIDRQAAAALLLETVRIGAGQGLHQRGLAVVDVTRRGDDVHGSLADRCRGLPAAPG